MSDITKWAKRWAEAPETDHTSYFDKWGACKVCGGELPHGHRGDCAIYALERDKAQNAALVVRNKYLAKNLVQERDKLLTMVKTAGKFQALYQYYGANHPLTVAAFRNLGKQLMANFWFASDRGRVLDEAKEALANGGGDG